MAFVGDYVYLPYAHINMLEPSSITHGCFLKQEDWTIDMVCRLLDHRPKSWMGGEVTSYQNEEVPKFLTHIRELDSAMWEALVEARPDLDIEPDHVGRKAILATLNSPIEWSTALDSSGCRSYPVRWTWDGHVVSTKSGHAYNSTWGRLKLTNMVIEDVPEDGAEVVVRNNSWVNSSTIFVD